MKFETMQKLYKAKRKLYKVISNTWYTLMYPVAWILDLHSDYKYKHFKKKVNNLTIQEIGELMAKRTLKKLTRNPKRVYEFYVCESSYYSDEEPMTVIDYMIDELYYSEGKWKFLYKWAYEQHHHYNMNGVWLNEAITQVIHDELSCIKGLDVHWEYVCQINEGMKYIELVKDYQKHLVIKVKE